jgi:adenylate cyclase
MSAIRPEVPLLVVFVDLTRFAVQSQRVRDSELADTLDAYYERVAVTVEAAGGRVVKYIGDGALVVFGEDTVDRGRRCSSSRSRWTRSWRRADGTAASS